jgi:hypothetical protein
MLTSLGKVTVSTPGTLVRATANVSSPTAKYLAHSIMIEAWPANVGKIYICDSASANRSTGVGVVAILGVPTSSSIPTFTNTMTGAIAAINLEQLWIDADIGDDAVLVVADIP